MKNNQFKKLIRTTIEEYAHAKNFQLLYVDLSNNERIFYLYDSKFNPYGTLRLFLNSSDYSIHWSFSTKATVNYSTLDAECKGSYIQVKDAINMLSNFISKADEIRRTASISKEAQSYVGLATD